MTAAQGRILVVDDDAGLRELLELLLRREGYEVDLCVSAEEALDRYAPGRYEVVLEDLRLPKADGIRLLKEIRGRDPEAVVVIMTAYSTWETAVEAMRFGAYDYIRKPFDNEEVKVTLRRAARLARERREGRMGEVEDFLSRQLIGSSDALRELKAMIRRVAPTDSTVLIQGESGTGKELVARAIHHGSGRASESFVGVNCGAFTETLLESELFGHVRGAFTGAVADKRGLVEVADQGTFFLDEVGETSPALQVKLLRLLEEREFMPVGGSRAKKVDVRFITATNRSLEEELQKGRFREDLFYRLNVIPIRVPPLRERPEDVPLLAGHFLARYAEKVGSRVRTFDRKAMEVLVRYSWPGNVRELENAVQRAVVVCDEEEVRLKDLDPRLLRIESGRAPSGREGEPLLPEGGIDLEKQVEDLERRYIQAALQRTEGNITQAAKLLGLSFRPLRYKIKKLGIRPFHIHVEAPVGGKVN
jgi:two-component system response regulator PilR (NtrC family)